jgi:hypothetical protein
LNIRKQLQSGGLFPLFNKPARSKSIEKAGDVRIVSAGHQGLADLVQRKPLKNHNQKVEQITIVT